VVRRCDVERYGCGTKNFDRKRLYGYNFLLTISFKFFCDNKKVDSEEIVHCKKRLTIFPSPAGMSLTKLFLDGNNLIISCQGEFGAGDGKIANLFYSVARPDG
jgi:hypothetical protein